jgi:hypothetical protein
MQKDGTHRVVYGTQLKDITGKVKMVAVGYGREAEDGELLQHFCAESAGIVIRWIV